mgnify:CR=1 FL=1
MGFRGCMNKLTISHIDSNVRGITRMGSKKYEIPRGKLASFHTASDSEKLPRSSWKVNIEKTKYLAYKCRAIKAFNKRGSSEFIRDAEKSLCYFYNTIPRDGTVIVFVFLIIAIFNLKWCLYICLILVSNYVNAMPNFTTLV